MFLNLQDYKTYKTPRPRRAHPPLIREMNGASRLAEEAEESQFPKYLKYELATDNVWVADNGWNW